jgi:hypothetical protein
VCAAWRYSYNVQRGQVGRVALSALDFTCCCAKIANTLAGSQNKLQQAKTCASVFNILDDGVCCAPPANTECTAAAGYQPDADIILDKCSPFAARPQVATVPAGSESSEALRIGNMCPDRTS